MTDLDESESPRCAASTRQARDRTQGRAGGRARASGRRARAQRAGAGAGAGAASQGAACTARPACCAAVCSLGSGPEARSRRDTRRKPADAIVILLRPPERFTRLSFCKQRRGSSACACSVHALRYSCNASNTSGKHASFWLLGNMIIAVPHPCNIAEGGFSRTQTKRYRHCIPQVRRRVASRSFF
ncbi:uncharacterized protein [Hemitrygon akajei]|uniref:uncharacterized protein isoform X2 n=1 Tax=Hemitrygon akajei TaxID=2704970 RepID=UPI003BF9BB9D